MSGTIALTILLAGHSGDIPKGADARKIGKIKPGKYLAVCPINTLPTAKSLSKSQIASYTGLAFYPDKTGDHGYLKRHYLKGKYQEAQDSPLLRPGEKTVFADALKLQKDLSKVHVCPIFAQRFSLDLPADADKLRGFTGLIVMIPATQSSKYLKMVNGKFAGYK